VEFAGSYETFRTFVRFDPKWAVGGRGLQQPDELVSGHARLLDDAGERAPLQVFAVVGNRDAQGWLVRMLEDVVSARGVVHKKAPSPEGLQYSPRSQRRQSLAHTPCSTT
jgi:hypothetical protein